MSRRTGVFLLFTALAVLATSAAPVRAAQDGAPIRHLLYTFTVSIASDLTVHSSGFGSMGGDAINPDAPPSSGVNDFRGSTADRGTIVLDVMQVAGDGGLVVRVSEDASGTRSAKPALCAIYGSTTQVTCEAGAKVNDEEMQLLRVAGRGFFDPRLLDAQNHWAVHSKAQGLDEACDYTVSGITSEITTIAFSRSAHQTGAQRFDSTTDGTILYEAALTIPSAVRQHTVVRSEVAMGQSNTTETRIDLTLSSDSLQPHKQ